MNTYCNMAGCHDNQTKAGGHPFLTYEGVKDAADEGHLKERVIEKKNMPPSKKLTQLELDQLDCWIKQGAKNN